MTDKWKYFNIAQIKNVASIKPSKMNYGMFKEALNMAIQFLDPEDEVVTNCRKCEKTKHCMLYFGSVGCEPERKQE